ncbi:MAG: hypothetical protein H0X24_08140 [Ktedonobacterales bacterium]|nr:hypothetical protein [Ktedonobacterales bacterium]
MGSRLLLVYEPLGGSAKRYRIRRTGETISYRQFRKYLLAESLEKGPAPRKMVLCKAPRRPRKDKGISRLNPPKIAARKRRRLAPVTLPVVIEAVHGKQRGVYRVVWQGTPLGEYHDTVYGARHWACRVCGLALREEASMIRHIYDHHRVVMAMTPVLPSAATPAYGGRVLYTGDVRSRSRKLRMPWRTSL